MIFSREMKIYRFHIRLRYWDEVWRTIDIGGDQTLDDLHYAIQRAFNWDDDHLYSFFLSGRYNDTKSEYTSSRGRDAGSFGRYISGEPKSRDTDITTIDSLGLLPGKTIAYLFDYGDNWRHMIKLLDILDQEPGASYPRIVECCGEDPEQYPDHEEDSTPKLSDTEILAKLGGFAPLAIKVRESSRAANDDENEDEEDKCPSREGLEKQYVLAMELYEAVRNSANDTRQRHQFKSVWIKLYKAVRDNVSNTQDAGSNTDCRKEPRLFELFDSYASYRISYWVTTMPLALARAGLVTEALRMSLAWSDIIGQVSLLGDRAVILAQAGMAEEAREQIRINLERFPDDETAHLSAGEAFFILKDYSAAEAQYKRCLELTDEEDFYISVQTQMIPVLKAAGKTAEAKAIEAEQKQSFNERLERMAPWIPKEPIVRQTPKVGRNDPCPCGSGKKYKKCCFGKDYAQITHD